MSRLSLPRRASERSAGSRGDGPVGRRAAAIVEKGADGRLTIDRHASTTSRVGPDDLLLGAALVVLAAPVGIAFLVPLAATWSACRAGVAALVGHIWHDIPKSELRRMSDLLEVRLGGLLVAVAVDEEADGIRAALTGATIALVTNGVTADLEALHRGAGHRRGERQPLDPPAHLIPPGSGVEDARRGSWVRTSGAAVTPAGAGAACPWPRPGRATRPPRR